MSLNHILETARKLGIPVVITNDRGEAPQVVMPFEDFASMVGVSRPVVGKPRISREPSVEDEVAQALADLTMERVEQEELPSVEVPSRASEEVSGEDFLEDHFYFEPIDDKESS